MSPFIRPPSIRSPDRAVARSVCLILLAVYTATFSGLPGTIEGEIEFQTISALARTGSLALEGTPETDGIRSMLREDPALELPLRDGREERGPRVYSTSGIGQAIVGLPFYFVGKLAGLLAPSIEKRHANLPQEEFFRSEFFAHLYVSWRSVLLTALTAWLLVLTCRRMGTERRSAWIAGLSYGLTTFAWSHARSTSSEVQLTFFLFLAFHAIIHLREEFERLLRPGQQGYLGLGFALGGALLTQFASLPAVIVLNVAGAIVIRRGCAHLASWRASAGLGKPPSLWPTLLRVWTPQVLCLGTMVALDAWRFGEFTGLWILPDEQISLMGVVESLVGLTLAPGKGLLWMAPAVLLVGFGLRNAARLGERSWIFTTLALMAAALIPIVGDAEWYGTQTYGPRFLLPLLPFLWIGVAFALEASRVQSWLRVAAAVAFGMGFLIQIPASLVDYTTHEALAREAAHHAWPELSLSDAPEAERLQRIQWSWGFAAPWAHWRIFRHRVAAKAEQKEVFPLREIYRINSNRAASPAHERQRGFAHLAWVYFQDPLGGAAWPVGLLLTALVISAIHLSRRGLGRRRN